MVHGDTNQNGGRLGFLLVLPAMKIPFFKYEGTGNDFIMVDNRNRIFPLESSLIARLCDRRFGIGADGLILLQEEEGFDFRMVYFNSDGRESTFCGNGGRCVAAFARQLNLVKDSARFVARDGEHLAVFSENLVRLKMMNTGLPREEKNGFSLFTGSPHFVCFVPDAAQADVFLEGRRIRQSFGEEGINVNFVEKKADRLLVRTYERGVEDETYSCGTGVTAAALISSLDGYSSPVLLETKGGELRVDFIKKDEGFTDVHLQGPARLVFSGIISL